MEILTLRLTAVGHCRCSVETLGCLQEEAQEVELLVLGRVTATSHCVHLIETLRCSRWGGVCGSGVDLGSPGLAVATSMVAGQRYRPQRPKRHFH
jgi:hypothetical protein